MDMFKGIECMFDELGSAATNQDREPERRRGATVPYSPTS